MSKNRDRFVGRRAFSVASVAPASLEPLEPRLLLSLVAHLELNETSGNTAADTVSDHDGTRYGGTVWDDGRIDSGAYFDGYGDYIDVDNSEGFNFGATDSFTISTWVRDDGGGNFAAALIRGGTSAIGLGYGSNSAGPGFFMGRYSTAGNSYMFTLSDGAAGTYAVYSPAYADGYHLLTMVADRSTDELRCYTDGVLFATKDISSVGSLDGGSDILQVGGGPNTWKGIIDDVRIYDHALSTSDVEDLYEDAPTWISLYADDPIATEDNSGADTATFRFLRTGTLSGAITVNYSVSGTVTDADYSETLGGTVTIGDGESYTEITITPVSDSADNGETLTLTLAPGTGYVISEIDEATAVIYDEAGLLAHWTLDETSGSTAADDTGNEFTGTLVGDTTWTTGWIDNGASFDGSGDYITAANSSGLDFSGDQSFTVSAWVRDDGSHSGDGVVVKGNTNVFYGTTEGSGWGIGKYGSAYAFAVTDGTNFVRYVNNVASAGTGFHLLTMTVDRDAQYLNCYIDGQLKNQLDISSVGSLASFGESLYIGLGYHSWNGVIDDARIYDCALDSTSIQSLYESTMPPVSIVATDSSAIEDSANTATFRISRTGTSGTLTVNYSVSGTASSADYSETLGGMVTIADGNSYADITITPVNDATGEGSETLILTLAGGTGYKVGEADEATVTIYDTGELMMHLELDETSGSTAGDSVSDHDGTRYGGTVWDDGRIDNGAYFDGAGDYINVDNSEDFNFGVSDSFTISTWVRDDGGGNFAAALIRGGTTAVGLGYGGNSAGPGFFMGRYSTVQGAYMFTLSDGSAGTYAIYNPGYTDGYHLLTMVADRSTNELYCYADGVLFATKNISSVGSLDGGSDILQVGGGPNTWKGIIDDVRVYNYALSGTDVLALYDGAPTWVTIYADDAIATEEPTVGSDGATFRILRTGSIGEALTVNYSVSGTASSADYSETLSGTVVFEIGQREAEIVVTPVADVTADDGETLTLTLASGTGYVPSDIDAGTVMIYDESQLLTHWEMDETFGTSASDSTGNGFTATGVGGVAWTYGRVDNGAYLTTDYFQIEDATELDFGGDQSFTISAWVRDDGSTSHPAAIAKGNTKAHYGQVSDGAGWSMGRYSSGSFAFGVSDGTTAENFIVSGYGYGDFHFMTMTVDRGANVLRGYIDGVLVGQEDISDIGSLASFDETLYIGLGYAKWLGVIDDVRVYTYALNSAEIAVLYDDAPQVVAMEVLDGTASETGSEPGAIRFTREGSTAEALEVDYTVTGTAVGADYSETLSGTVTFAVGESYVDVTIAPVDDASNEGDETVIVTLTPSATNVYSILATTVGTGTITIGDSDNVADPQVVIGMADNEGSEDGNDPATFRIYRSGATTSDLAVNYTVSGTAESDDYSETLSGTVTITSGNSYADITITPVTDSNFEYPETLTLTLTADAGYSIGLSDEASATIFDVPFSEQLNPTGDMIGGGEGYSDIIDIGDADYVVDTAQELVDALSSATYGDIIYVEDDAEIDLTGYIADTSYNALFIPAGVTLASGRGNNGSSGGLIYTTDNWSSSNRVAMLGTAGDDIRVTGLRLQGPSGSFLYTGVTNYNAIGVRCFRGGAGTSGHKNIEVDNCEIYNWTQAGVCAYTGEGLEVHHNFIHTNIADGYAYGVWLGGVTVPGAEWVAEVDANLFECNRHDIGAGCHWPYAARYNIFGPTKYQQITDRHAGASVDTWLENNWNQATESLHVSGNNIEFRAGFTSDGGGTVYYNNNWTTKDTVGPGTTSSVVYAQAWPTLYFDTEASGNTCSFDDYDDAYTPVAAASVTYLSTPLTVAFDSSASYDPEGNDIVAHQWWFNDGSSVQGVVSYEDNPTYTFSAPGMYEVVHWAYNEYGVAGYETIPVLVRPEGGGYWLSAWILDDSNASSGVITKQILIDDEVVWSDDVDGDEGWQHVVVDITEYVTEGTGAELAFCVVSDGGPYAKVAVDNVYILGGDVGGGQMTSGTLWTVVDPDGGSSGWIVNNSTGLVGRLATQGAQITTWGTAGTGGVTQIVPIGKALQPMVTDDFESGDGTGGDNWDANWVLTGSAAITSSGTPYDGTYHLLLTGSSAVASRAVDLGALSEVGYDDVTLSFQYKADSFETGEEVSVEIYDGTQWQEVVVIEDGDDDGEYHLASIDLSGYSLTDDFEVRFTASLADASDFFYIDDLMIA